jgi:hypothetical protein
MDGSIKKLEKKRQVAFQPNKRLLRGPQETESIENRIPPSHTDAHAHAYTFHSQTFFVFPPLQLVLPRSTASILFWGSISQSTGV